MKIGNRSFSTRISLNILLVVAILFIISIAIVAVSSHRIIADEATRSAQNILDAKIAELERTLSNVEMTAQGVAWLAKDRIEDTSYLYEITHIVVESNPNVVGSAIAFEPDYFPDKHYFSPYSTENPKTHNVTTFQLGSDKYNYFQMEWFQNASSTGDCVWSDPYFDEGGGEMLMSTYSVPIVDDSGHVFAVLTADISLEWASDVVGQIRPYPRSQATLVSKTGKYVGSEHISELTNTDIFQTANLTGNESIMDISRNMVDGKKGVSHYAYKGQVSFAVYGPLENGWSLSIICEYRDVLKRSTQMHLVLIIVALVGLLAMFIICYRIVRRLTRPVTELSVSAMNMAKGNFHAHIVDVDTNDEMRKLHDSFAYMQRSINDYIAQLKTTTALNERMEGELNVARNIQMSMLNKDFPHGSFSDSDGNTREYGVQAFLQPAKEVGGDLYDVWIRNDKLYFSVGDVSGKGVPAALYMAITRSALRFMVGLDISMGQVLRKVNDILSDGNTHNMFCTIFVGCIDLKTGEMEYCNGGHNPIVVMPPDAPAYFLKAKTNIAAGIFSGFDYQDERMTLAPGTKLLLYTDGVSEAETQNKEQFGDERLLAWANSVAQRGDCMEKELVEDLYDAVKAFTQGNEPNDDITIMAVRV